MYRVRTRTMILCGSSASGTKLCHCVVLLFAVCVLFGEESNASIPCVIPANDPSIIGIVDILNTSVLYVTPSFTVAAGDDAVVFKIEYNLTNLHQNGITTKKLSIVPYVNDDDSAGQDACLKQEIDGCLFKVLSKTCIFDNVTLSKNDTTVQFFLVYHADSESVIRVCQPKSILFVEAISQPVAVLNATVGCDGISLTLQPFPSDTLVTCQVYYNNTTLVYNDSDCNNSTVIPASVLSDHTSQYTIVSQSKKKVARSDKRYKNITLESKNLKYDVTGISIKVIENEFFAIIDLKVNKTCELSVPNNLTVSSNCSDNEQTVTVIPDNVLVISHKLNAHSRYCTFTIEDNGGNIITNTTTLSSFNIQEFRVLRESLVCLFALGSTVTECNISITGNNSNTNNITITRESSDSLLAERTIPLSPAGLYIIQVIEEDTVIITESVSIIPPSVSISVTTTTATVTVTATTSIVTTSVFAVPDNKVSGHYKNATVALIVVLVLILGIVIVIGILVAYMIKSKKYTYIVDEGRALLFGHNRNVDGDGGPDPVHANPDPVRNNPDPVRNNPDPVPPSPDPVRIDPNNEYKSEALQETGRIENTEDRQNSLSEIEASAEKPMIPREPEESSHSGDGTIVTATSQLSSDVITSDSMQQQLPSDHTAQTTVEGLDEKSTQVYSRRSSIGHKEYEVVPPSRSLSITSQGLTKVEGVGLSIVEDTSTYSQRGHDESKNDKKEEYADTSITYQNHNTNTTSNPSETTPLFNNNN